MSRDFRDMGTTSADTIGLAPPVFVSSTSRIPESLSRNAVMETTVHVTIPLSRRRPRLETREEAPAVGKFGRRVAQVLYAVVFCADTAQSKGAPCLVLFETWVPQVLAP